MYHSTDLIYYTYINSLYEYYLPLYILFLFSFFKYMIRIRLSSNNAIVVDPVISGNRSITVCMVSCIATLI